LPYTTFWHHYVHQHANGGGPALTVNPAAAFAVAVCLFLIACWAANQIQSRCEGCGAIPARCRCLRDRVRSR
jgi:hypothetical protein